MHDITNGDANNLLSQYGSYSIYLCHSPMSNTPMSDGYLIALSWFLTGYTTQVFINNNDLWIRRLTVSGSTRTWSDWEKISKDIPNFYKSYANIGELATGLGIYPYLKPNSDPDSPWAGNYDALVFRFIVGDYMGEIAFMRVYVSAASTEAPHLAIRYKSQNWSPWKYL